MRNSWKSFLRRPKSAHKGDFGKVLIVAGSRGMSGAARLTAMAALRSGAGLVTLAVPESIHSIVARQDPEVMVMPFQSTRAGSLDEKSFAQIFALAKTQDVLALGPGLSRNPSTVKLIHKLIIHSPVPTVLDADALNALEGNPSVLLKAQAPLFLTPHEKEFERVFGVRCAGAVSRKNAARDMAEKFGVYVVLKGHRTVVASPDGKVFVNQTGNPGMATAGCGDVLTGVLAGLLGVQKNYFETACLAVTAHGLAGDFAEKKTGQTGLIARDILEFLPAAFKKLVRA